MVDPPTALATELAELPARRWEHELHCRKLKRQLRRIDLLRSHAVEIATQEVATFVPASAVRATQRLTAAG